ncbi:MAG: oligosaccharide flippase family protein [Deltaproteobacteria bacterium]|nr:oligosaccharide flippase family protein [Deltaproteobacteria bacterium]
MSEQAGQGGAGGPAATRFAGAALLLAVSVLLSRALGFVREMVLAYQLGTSPELDAYYAAFQIPDMLNYFLAGGALSIAFVPFYTRARSQQGEAAAGRLLANVLGSMTGLALLATLAMWWQAEALVALQFPRFAPEIQTLTVRLTRILLPAQVFFVAGGIVRAALMARGSFGTQALAPLIYNAGIIAGGGAFGATLGPEGFAWGALVGAAIGPFLVPLWDAWRRRDLALGVRFAPWEREFLSYLVIAAPLMLGVSLLTVDEWYDKWFGALISAGVVAQLGLARRLMQLPVAVVGQAIATAALPTLSKLWADGRKQELDRMVQTTLQASLGLALLAAAGSWALAEPLVTLVYQRGAFSAEDTVQVARLLQIFSLAVPAWIVQHAAIPLYLALGKQHGAPGIAAAGVIGMTTNALVTLAFARWLHGAPVLGALGASALRGGAIAALAGVAARAAALLMAAEQGPMLQLALGGTAFFVLVAVCLPLFGDAEMRAAVGRITRLLTRSRSRG